MIHQHLRAELEIHVSSELARVLSKEGCQDLESATAIRAKENEDFQKLEKELMEAVRLLNLFSENIGAPKAGSLRPNKACSCQCHFPDQNLRQETTETGSLSVGECVSRTVVLSAHSSASGCRGFHARARLRHH